MMDYVICAKCTWALPKHKAVGVTVRISPAKADYYHPECYDPWSEVAVAEDRAAMGIGPLDDPGAEVRTVSSTGGEKGTKPARFDLIPVGPLTTVAKLYGKGAEKYADHNWRQGYEWSKSYAALMRHATQFWNGEDDDEETDLPHMASVAWHALALIEFMESHRGYDDRHRLAGPPPSE